MRLSNCATMLPVATAAKVRYNSFDGSTTHLIVIAVLQAVRNVNEIIGPALHKASLKVTDQEDVDELLKKLDGTPNKSKLGANAIVGVSLAVAKAGAGEKNIPLYQHFAELAGVQAPYILPTPCFNVINGGKHAGNELAFQEFMIIPIGASSFQEAMMYATDTYHALKKVITAKYGINGKYNPKVMLDIIITCEL